MFDVGIPELVVLAIVAVFVFGPDRLPDVARQAARMLHSLRRTVSSARGQIAEELGPEFADFDLRDLNPRTLVQKHILDDIEDDDERPLRPGHRPLKPGESAPFDAEAT